MITERAVKYNGAMYRPHYFSIEELIPQHVYQDRGERGWELLDDRLLIALDQLREEFGPIYLNTWHNPRLQKAWGYREWSGLRTERSPVGSFYSQHRFGRAADCLFAYGPAADVREGVLKNRDRFPFITSLELEVPWFHFDVRNCEPIKTYTP